DEPVSALDRLQGADVLGKLCARNHTVIVAMHDISLALAHADRVVVMDDGRIVLDAPARSVAAADLVPYYGGCRTPGQRGRSSCRSSAIDPFPACFCWLPPWRWRCPTSQSARSTRGPRCVA